MKLYGDLAKNKKRTRRAVMLLYKQITDAVKMRSCGKTEYIKHMTKTLEDALNKGVLSIQGSRATEFATIIHPLNAYLSVYKRWNALLKGPARKETAKKILASAKNAQSRVYWTLYSKRLAAMIKHLEDYVKPNGTLKVDASITKQLSGIKKKR
jgi:hypothetical protein